MATADTTPLATEGTAWVAEDLARTATKAATYEALSAMWHGLVDDLPAEA